MNGNLLFALQPARSTSVGERVTIARNAGRPTSTFAIWTPGAKGISPKRRSEEHTSELQSRGHLVCRLLLERHANLLSHPSFPTRRSSDLFVSGLLKQRSETADEWKLTVCTPTGQKH